MVLLATKHLSNIQIKSFINFQIPFLLIESFKIVEWKLFCWPILNSKILPRNVSELNVDMKNNNRLMRFQRIPISNILMNITLCGNSLNSLGNFYLPFYSALYTFYYNL